MAFGGIYSGKRVLVTGHTGFKGSWLCEWLLTLGAEVYGYALDPFPEALMFDQLNLSQRMAGDYRGDLADQNKLIGLVADIAPDFVFHLAAQSIVRRSYEIPSETFAVNVMGTIHVMEALRQMNHPCAAVLVTTDKCYENREWLHAYREEDPMGGHDPYSASKGAAEIAISAWRRSYFSALDSKVKIASARAGNVIGGGDWAQDRIVPDCIRSIQSSISIPVRNLTATRPWQHVLEPLSGYICLAAKLKNSSYDSGLNSAFNFGPSLDSNRSVAELVIELTRYLDGAWHDASEKDAPHEAGKLNLATAKSYHLLEWLPVWSFETTVRNTAEWYLQVSSGSSAVDLTAKQISNYIFDAAAMQVPWAASS